MKLSSAPERSKASFSSWFLMRRRKPGSSRLSSSKRSLSCLYRPSSRLNSAESLDLLQTFSLARPFLEGADTIFQKLKTQFQSVMRVRLAHDFPPSGSGAWLQTAKALNILAIVISSTVEITREEALRPKAMPDRLPAHPSPDLAGPRKEISKMANGSYKIVKAGSVCSGANPPEGAEECASVGRAAQLCLRKTLQNRRICSALIKVLRQPEN